MARTIPGFGDRVIFSNKLVPFLQERVASISPPELATVRFKDREKYEAEIQRLLALRLPSRSKQVRTDFNLELEQNGLLVESTSVDCSYHIQGVKFWGRYRPGSRRHFTYSEGEYNARFDQVRAGLRRMNGHADDSAHRLHYRDPITSTEVKHVVVGAEDMHLGGAQKRAD